MFKYMADIFIVLIYMFETFTCFTYTIIVNTRWTIRFIAQFAFNALGTGTIVLTAGLAVIYVFRTILFIAITAGFYMIRT